MSDPASHNILNDLRRLMSTLFVASRQTEKQFGISAAQLFALKKLQDGKKRSLNELAQLTYTHQSSLSVVIRKLVEKGLIQSQTAADDARRLVLGLSGKGQKLLEKASVTVQDRLLLALSQMDPQDRAQLGLLLNELLDRAEMKDEPPNLFFEYDEPPPKEDTHERRKTARAMQQQGSSGPSDH